MTKTSAGFFALLLGALSIGFALPASATPTDPNEDHKVTICHRTGSADGGELKNGYNEITVDIASSGLVKGGHTGHEQIGNGPGPDIIPAYEAYAKVMGEWVEFSYPGLNLDYVFEDGTTGAEFLANGCALNTPPDVETSVDVVFIDPTCDAPRGDLELVYNENEVTYSIQGEVGPGQEVTVVFEAKDGFVIEGDSVFTHTFGMVPTNCEEPVEVRADVDFTDPTCDNRRQSEILYDRMTGVDYNVVRGTPMPGNTVLIEATATDGYVLVGKTAWAHEFGFAPTKAECSPGEPNEPPRGSPNPPATPELPQTGGSLGALGIALGLLASGGGLVLGSRRLFA